MFAKNSSKSKMYIMVNGLLGKIKNIILTDPKELYEKERAFLDQPFYFPGTNGQAVLLIHGWTSVPYEVRRLGKYLNEKGYTVCGPMLRGHGTVPKNLEDICWQDWLADIIKNYTELKNNHQKVYVAGTSIGANLAVMLAKNKPDISGLVLMAMPYKIRLERMAIFFASFLSLFKKYNQKFYPPTFGSVNTITRLISYQSYPIVSALETFKLVKISRGILDKINQPCFVLQSTSDHVVAGKSLEKIYTGIKSKIKKKKYIEKAYHTFISDIKGESVFEDILKFLEEN